MKPLALTIAVVFAYLAMPTLADPVILHGENGCAAMFTESSMVFVKGSTKLEINGAPLKQETLNNMPKIVGCDAGDFKGDQILNEEKVNELLKRT